MISTYSHAAPYIREAILNTMSLKLSANTKRDQYAYGFQLHGLIQALEILLASPEGKNSPTGQPDFWGHRGAYAEAERYVGGRERMLKLGFEPIMERKVVA